MSSSAWDEYRIEMLSLIRQAMSDYSALGTGVEPIFQISIWTDVQGPQSAVSFETKEHARAAIDNQASFLESVGYAVQAREVRSAEFFSNPASFKYPSFATMENRSLLPLAEAARSSDEHRRQLEEQTFDALISVVDEIVASKAIWRSPTESTIWIGVSSPRDWYDSVTPYERPLD